MGGHWDGTAATVGGGTWLTAPATRVRVAPGLATGAAETGLDAAACSSGRIWLRASRMQLISL